MINYSYWVKCENPSKDFLSAFGNCDNFVVKSQDDLFDLASKMKSFDPELEVIMARIDAKDASGMVLGGVYRS